MTTTSCWRSGGYVGDDVAAYVYATTGKKLGQKPGEMGPEDILALREGYTVADASNLFDASFRTAGVNPAEYLRDVLLTLTGRVRLMDLPDLLPARWSARRVASMPPPPASPTPAP